MLQAIRARNVAQDVIWHCYVINRFIGLGVHENTKNRLVVIFAGFTLLTEELSQKLGITDAYSQHIQTIERKLSDVDVNIFRTPALTQNNWRNSNAKKRHLVIRASVHGFHFKLCASNKCFERNENCLCRFCDYSSSSLLHVLECAVLWKRGLSFVNDLK